MGSERDVSLSRSAIDEFLEPGGVGVLALAKGDRPYAIPVSFGYAAGSDDLYFRLGRTDDAEKGSFLEAGQPARFVTFEPDGGRWTSVIVTGSLHEVTEEDLTAEAARVLRDSALPLYDIWDVDVDDVTFHVHRLGIETIAGRRSRPTD